MKPVVAVKDDFGYRDNSKVIGYFGTFGLPKFWFEKKSTVWFVKSFPRVSSFPQRPRWKNQTSSYGDLRLSKSRWNIIKLELFGLSEDQYSNTRTKNAMQGTNRRNSFWKHFDNKNFLIEASTQKMKPVVVGDKWSWVWMSGKTIERFFLEKLDYQDSDETNKMNGFPPDNPCTSFFLDWVHDGGILICSDWGIQVSKWTEIEKKSTSWNFRTVKTLMQGTRINNSPIENLSTSKKFSMLTLIEEIKPVVQVNHEFENREKLKLKYFLWRFGTIRLLMQEKKTINF